MEKLTGIRFGLFIAALFMTNFIIMTDFVIFPIADVLYTQFPDQVNGVNFIISGPSAIIVVASLLIPSLLDHVDRKLLLLIGCAAFAVSAIGGCAIQSVPYMIACRSVGGATYAIVQVCAISIISDYWPDENKRASIVGYYNTAQAAAGGIMSFISGNLALNGWTASYQTYWIAVPVFLMVLLFIPNMKGRRAAGRTDDTVANREVPAAKPSWNLGAHFWAMVACFVVPTICYMIAVNSFVSVYVVENGLGDASLAGLLTTMGTIGSATMCALFGRVFKRLGLRTSLPNYFIMAVCLFVMFLRPPVPAIMVCCLLSGGCFGTLFSYNYAAGSMIVEPQNVDRATGVVTSAYGLATFVSTYFATFLMDVMGTGFVVDIFPVLVGMCLFAGIVEVVRNVK